MPGPYMPQRLVWLVVVFFPIALLGGCTTTPPDDHELSDIEAGKKTLVLLRMATSIRGEAYRPFGNFPATKNIGFGIGTFQTGGRLEEIAPVNMRFLSEKSLQQGWTYVLVPPGPLYLVFVPPPGGKDHHEYRAMFDAAKPWRVDVPEGRKFLYVGTLSVAGNTGSQVFSGEFLQNFENMEVLDERATAQRLVDNNLTGLGKIETVLMQPHEGPIILKTPTN